MPRSSIIGIFYSLLLICICACSQTDPIHHADYDPEAASGLSGVKRYHAKQSMVVTANPHATQAALKILDAGGSATDAAIAAQLVLTLVEPQSSGIGGGAFLMHWQADNQQLQLFDGRETAPAAVDQNYYLDSHNKPRDFFSTMIGGYSVGTPGVVAMMATAHQQHGKLPWKELFAPAITLAKQGFSLSPRLHALLSRFNRFFNHPSSRDYFYQANGEPKAIGSVLKNPELASTLQRLAEQGAAAFYRGELANSMVQAVQNDPLQPGTLTRQDLANYQPLVRTALCGPFHAYTVCTTPPPSSGATVLQILGILAHLPQPTPTPGTADWIHRFAEASKLAFADRDTYIGDPDFVEVPVQALVAQSYLQQRAQLIDLNKASGTSLPGQPKPALARRPGTSPELPSTSHLSIIDANGNALSMTSSVQMAFGSGVMVGGFLLNNQLTDFSYSPTNQHQELIANRVQPGKRPRSSMSPTIVFNNNQPVMLIGSPGGSRIIDYVARVLAYSLNSTMDIADAIAAGNIVHMNRTLELEEQKFDATIIKQLQHQGHTIKERAHNSGLHGIWIAGEQLIGGADPRREGTGKGR